LSWTTPRTWVAGETPTASIFNTHVRDNLSHLSTQGVGATPTYSSANYGGSSSLTWTVSSGDVTVNRYSRIGNQVVWRVTLGNTNQGGSVAATELRISLPISTGVLGGDGAYGYADNNTYSVGLYRIVAGTTYVSLYKNNAGAWSGSTAEATHIFGTFVYEIST
jgi:hypothetical protein